MPGHRRLRPGPALRNHTDLSRSNECLVDGDCNPTQRCGTTEVCLDPTGCRTDADCATGQSCGSTQECLDPGKCQADADCATGQNCGSTQECLDPGSCRADSDCSGNLSCKASQVCLDPNACRADADCLNFQRCGQLQECLNPGRCEVDADCTGTQRCGVTKECLDPGACRDNADCPITQSCGALSRVCLNPGACREDADCGPAESCQANLCVRGNTGCGQDALTIDAIAPNLLILIDISGSMNIPPTAGGVQSKLAIAKRAITQLTTTYQGRVNWGLATFPSDGNCGPPAAPGWIPPGPGQEGVVSLATNELLAAGNTPINASIAAIQGSGLLSDPTRPNYLLFISDGAETCGGNNANTASRIGQMFTAGIGTFVVGFGSGVDQTSLNAFAIAGGYPNPGIGNSYFAADNATSLQQALDAILQTVISCDFPLTQTPTDPNLVSADFDGVEIPRNDPNGWTLDTATNTITFTGGACTQLKTGTVNQVNVIFGCPPPG